MFAVRNSQEAILTSIVFRGWAPMNNGNPIADGIGVVGADVVWGRMEKTGRYSYLGIAPNSGALR